MLREQALTQRVAKEQQAEPVQASLQLNPTTFPTIEVEDQGQRADRPSYHKMKTVHHLCTQGNKVRQEH